MSIDHIYQSVEQYKNMKVDSTLASDSNVKINRDLTSKRVVPIKPRTNSLNINPPVATDIPHSHLEFEINHGPNHIVVKVVDTDTGEIIRRIPNLESSPNEINLGNLVDEKV